MGAAADLNLSGVLPPEPTSVGRARRMVASALETAGRGDLVETTVLLVSEVVTNSVLHAGTEIRLECHPRGSGVRIAVFDGSPVLPGVRHYDAEATTGRGLALVATLADSWGIACEEDGKALWFELGQRSDQKAPTLSPAEAGQPPVGGRASPFGCATPHRRWCWPLSRTATPCCVNSLSSPSAASSTSSCPRGGTCRNLTSRRSWPPPRQRPRTPTVMPTSSSDFPPGPMRPPSIAWASSTTPMPWPGRAAPSRRPPCLRSACAGTGLYTEIAVQAAGGPVRPWELPEPLEPARVAASLTPGALGDMEAVPGAAIVADDANRILIVNDTASDLLGWPPGALVGQRLTVVIPRSYVRPTWPGSPGC